jgi:hypothetical protein
MQHIFFVPAQLLAYHTAVGQGHGCGPAAQPGEIGDGGMNMTVDLVQTSCGYAVPFMDYAGERGVLDRWTEDKGDAGIREYWASTNAETIDGMPTGIEGPGT